MSTPGELLAERVGFEPTDLSVSGFQDRRNRPLCHLSDAILRPARSSALDDDRARDQVVPPTAPAVDEDPGKSQEKTQPRDPQAAEPQTGLAAADRAAVVIVDDPQAEPLHARRRAAACPEPGEIR